MNHCQTSQASAPRSSEEAIGAIRRLLGDEHFRPAAAADSVDGMTPRHVAEPASAAQAAGVLKICDEAGLRAVARGSGTKLDWGAPPAGLDLVLSTRRLDQVLEHAAGDMTATVQAGCTVTTLANALAGRGQRLALDPLWPDRATVGGIIATNDNGALRAAYGTLSDHLIGITVALADGTLARSGGKVVKNVAGYDLPKLFAGSFGTLGVITEATFRLYPLPKSRQTLRFVVPNTDVLARVMSALADCSLVTSSAQFEVDSQAPIEVCVLVEGLPEAIEGKVGRVTRGAAACGASRVATTTDEWGARERLFFDVDSCVAKVSLLPTNWPPFLDRLRELSARGGSRWKVVAQGVGVGMIRVAAAASGQLVAAVRSVREEVEKAAGSLIVLRCPSGLKGQVDIWPDGGNALPLMRRIKEQFDPHAILSPGRFLGGI